MRKYEINFLNDVTVFDGVDGSSLVVGIGLTVSGNGAWMSGAAGFAGLSTAFMIAFMILVIAVSVRWATPMP